MNGISSAFTGRVGQDPEAKYTQTGKALLTFSVGVDQAYTADESRPAPEPLWVKVTAWDTLAEQLAETLTKGKAVYVEGKLKLDRWTSKDGEPKAGLSCSAWRVDVHGQLGKASPQKRDAGW